MGRYLNQVVSDIIKSTSEKRDYPLKLNAIRKDVKPLPDEWGMDLLKKLLLENSDVNADFPRNK